MKSTALRFLTAFFLLVGIGSTAQESIIKQNELPQPAQKFISDNFPKDNIEFIKKDKETFSTDYTVRFSGGKEIEFDSDGNWTEVDGNKTAIPTAFIHKNILTYIKQKFPNTQIVKIEKGHFGKQEVKLSNGLELEFNSDGVFKRID